MRKEAQAIARSVYSKARVLTKLHSNGLSAEDNLVDSGRSCSTRLIRLKRRVFLVCFSLLCLSFAPAKSVISAPTAKDYKQFLGGVSFPYCDDIFDIPKFVDLQRKGSITGTISRAIFDGEEAKAVVFGLGAGGNCSYFRTSSGVIHKISFGKSSILYNGEPAKYRLKPPSEGITAFVDSNGKMHTIKYLHGQPAQTASIQKIPDGEYRYAFFQGDFIPIEIKRGQYRGFVRIPGKPAGPEGEGFGPWKPISKSGFRYVRKGVIYNPSTPKTPYWCSREASGWQPFSREYPRLFCTSAGLTSIMPATFKGMF